MLLEAAFQWSAKDLLISTLAAMYLLQSIWFHFTVPRFLISVQPLTSSEDQISAVPQTRRLRLPILSSSDTRATTLNVQPSHSRIELLCAELGSRTRLVSTSANGNFCAAISKEPKACSLAVQDLISLLNLMSFRSPTTIRSSH